MLEKFMKFFLNFSEIFDRIFVFTILLVTHIVGGSRGPKKANRNIVRQITKFGMIVACNILINIWHSLKFWHSVFFLPFPS